MDPYELCYELCCEEFDCGDEVCEEDCFEALGIV